MVYKCIENDCNKHSCFNYKNEKTPKYCSEHKLNEMIDIVHENCAFLNCNTFPIFNHAGKSKGIYCSEHKESNMINVISKQCNFEDCLTQPYFNFVGYKKAIRCSKHKESGMINVKNKSCNFDGCHITPKFNFVGDKKGLFCFEHKESGMINVLSDKCEEYECSTTAKYNFIEIRKGARCSKHVLPGMVDVMHKHCENSGCYLRPCYNFVGKKQGKFCKSHASSGMIDVRNPRFICGSCNLQWYKIKKDQILCSYCNPTKRQKTKEEHIKKLLEKSCITFINDKTFKNNYCLKYRPDFVIDCGTFYLILEVDEFGHISYPEECEIVRMNNIGYAFDKPVKFLRYNPDNKNFTKQNKEKVLLEEIQKIMNQEFLDNPAPKYLFYPTSS